MLSETFGEAKSNFLLALRSMKDTGELAWLTALPLLQPPPKLAPPATTAAAATSAAAATAAGSGAQWPPQLPPIHNAHLQKQIFTHKSHIQGQYASAHGVEHAHYERLEYLGDAYLQVIASHVLFDRFPAYREGGLSEMRQRLVCNSNLATYAEAYRMHQAFRGARGTETYQKNIADCFEAYVGALVLDRPTIAAGLREATDWLMALLEPKIREMEQQRGGVAALDKNAKQKLHLVVHGEHVRLDYRWTGGGGGNQGGYWMTVFLTGWGFCNKELGKGWGTKKLYPTLFLCICLSVYVANNRPKRDGELRAAMNFLENPRLVEEIRQAKLLFAAGAAEGGKGAGAGPSSKPKKRKGGGSGVVGPPPLPPPPSPPKGPAPACGDTPVLDY